MINIICLVIGFGLLIWGADRFVLGSSSLARRLGVPSLIIGLTVVALGTSAPELSVSVTAGIQGSNEIALGNVLGSNVFNLLCILGVCTLLKPLTVDSELLKRDWPVSIFITALLFVLMITDNKLSQIDAVIMLLVFSAVIYIQIRSAQKNKYVIKVEENMELKEPFKIGLDIVLGLGSIILGGQISVYGASGIAKTLGLSETLIGLTIVAVGTSLPELVTSVIATKKGETDIAIGNVIGSNIFNILFILGVSSFLNPIAIQVTAFYDTIFLFLISSVLFLLGKKNLLNRLLGILFILAYVSYAVWIIIR